MEKLNSRQRIAAALAAGALVAVGLVPATVASPQVAPTASASSLYSCVIDARTGFVGGRVIGSTQISCISAYGTPAMRATTSITRNGVLVLRRGPTTIAPSSPKTHWTMVLHASDVNYYRCSTYTVISEVRAASGGKSIGWDVASLRSSC